MGAGELETGRALLARFEGLRGLWRADVIELTTVPGIGEARAARVKAALELGQRLSTEPAEERPTVKAPADAAHLLADMCALTARIDRFQMAQEPVSRLISSTPGIQAPRPRRNVGKASSAVPLSIPGRR